jgi:hypothetical protein
MRNKIKRLEQAMREERHADNAKAEFVASIQELRRLAETGEPSEKHRIVDQDRNEVAGPIPDLSE